MYLSKMDTTVSLRLPRSLAKAIGDLAVESDRPKSYVIRRALEEYIADQVDARIAKERQSDPQDPTISSKQLRQTLGIK